MAAPVLKAQHLGIQFGGLKAVDDFNMEIGESELVGLTEFDGIRYDKDLIRSYLDGRFGGIPMLREEAARG